MAERPAVPVMSPGVPPVPPTGGLGRFATGAALVAVAATAVNVLGYVLALAGARLLDPASYGEYASLLALLTVFTVPQIGVQTVAAIHTARGDASPSALVRTALVTSAVTGTAVLATAPAVVAVLHLRSGLPVLLLALATVPLNAAGAHLGLLQGRERFARLGLGMLVLGVGRVGGGLAGLAIGRSVVATLAGVLVGGALAWALLWASTRRGDAGKPGGGWRYAREVAAVCGASLAMMALLHADLLLARAVLPGDEAGRYAVGAVLTKAAFWAPQVIAVVALPRLARGHAGTLGVGLCAVAAVGAVTVAGTALLGETAVRVAGGAAYLDLALSAWLFAAAGTAWALVNLVTTARIAAGARWVAVPLWTAIAVEAGLVLAWRPHSLTHTVLAALAVAGGTVAAGVLLRRRDRRSGAPDRRPAEVA